MKIKIMAIFLILFLLPVIFAGCAGEKTGENIEFETLAAGYNSQQVEPSYYVIKDEERLKEVWDKIGEGNAAEVDFNQNMVIAVFQGEQSTGGFEIKVNEIVETKENLNVYVKEIVPDPSDIVTQALSSPYHIVELERIEKKVEFITE
ncbi:MAG: protease complex subunit PrcB family protein [Candidatus Humimicrobiaceae bacterium]